MAAAREAWNRGEPGPTNDEIRKMHLMLQILMPSFTRARERHLRRIGIANGVLVAVDLEASRYAGDRYVLPADAKDPTCGLPWRLEPGDAGPASLSPEEVWYLRGAGPDGTFDDPSSREDTVVWGPLRPSPDTGS